MSEEWHRLHLANRGDIPPLLYKYSPASTGYELYMTDLNSMWSEHLDREAILKRADEDNTPIDPSEDLDQFKVLLTKIQEGLQSGPGSKVSLQSRTRGRDHTLELRVISKLPAPLEPLVWKVFLSKKAQSSMTRHLLLPLINAEAEREARQRSLIEELNKKDWVLSKLFDKFETLGIDLTAIFPGASGIRAGRKGLTLTEMGKYIKGLAPFDEESWREEISKSSSGSAFSRNIVAELSEGSPNSTQLGSLKLPPDGWWEGLTVSNNATSSTPSNDDKKPETNPAADSLETDTDSGSETGADEFERQETPPRLKKRSRSPRKSSCARKDDNKEAHSEDEEATSPKNKFEKATKHKAEVHSNPANNSKVPLPRRSKGLGKIGGKKQTRPSLSSPSPTPTPSPSPSPSHGMHNLSKSLADEETTDEDANADEEQQYTLTKTKHTPTSAPRKVPQQSRRLGVIGGKKKQATPEPEPRPERESEPEPEPSSKPSRSQSPEPHPPPKKKKPLGRIGVIGGHKSKQKAVQDRSSEAPSSSRTESVLPPAETAQRQSNTEDEAEKKERPASRSPSLREAKEANMKTPAKPEREETEEEKADRKREELKRQLEAKSKAPAKKKRRF
ncbi:XRCC4-like factor-domain-containing protein [Aspergillus tetrazonus]